MAALSFAEAVARLKAAEVMEVAALLLHDKDLQAVCACWPMVPREVASGELSAAATPEELWAAVAFDERAVVDLSGRPAALAMAAFRRAKGNRLIYPDGTLHKVAQAMLQQLIRSAFPAGKGRK